MSTSPAGILIDRPFNNFLLAHSTLHGGYTTWCRSDCPFPEEANPSLVPAETARVNKEIKMLLMPITTRKRQKHATANKEVPECTWKCGCICYEVYFHFSY
jgi:hypothetical protein